MNRPNRFFIIGLTSILIIFCPFYFSGFATEITPLSPGETLRTISSQLLEIKTNSTDDTTRRQSAAIIREYVAIRLITPHIYGREYLKLTDIQKHEFQAELLILLENSLTDVIQKNEIVLPEILEEKVRKNRSLVKFSITKPPKTSSYMFTMRKIDNSWKIFDVNVDGASMLKNFMYQIRPIVKKDGFQGVLKKLQEISADLPHHKKTP